MSVRPAPTPPPDPDRAPAPRITLDDYDWADHRLAAADRHQQAAEALTRPLEPRRARLARLVLIRESDQYDRALLEGGLRQACARNAAHPGVERVLAAGLRPLDDDNFDDFPVQRLRGKAFRSAFYVVDGTGWVLSPASANRTSRAGDNAFTRWLVQLIAEHQPVELDTVAFARLVRSLDHGPELGLACGHYVDRVRAGEHLLDFAGQPGTAQLMWHILSIVAAAERDEIVRRHTAGAPTTTAAAKPETDTPPHSATSSHAYSAACTTASPPVSTTPSTLPSPRHRHRPAPSQLDKLTASDVLTTTSADASSNAPRPRS